MSRSSDPVDVAIDRIAREVMAPREYNRRLPIPGTYAASWKALNAMKPDSQVRVPGWVVGMPGWGDQTVTVSHALGCLHAAMQNRINARAGFTPREPRESSIALYRDSRRIRDRLTRRLRVYQFETREARRRFSHLLADPND